MNTVVRIRLKSKWRTGRDVLDVRNYFGFYVMLHAYVTCARLLMLLVTHAKTVST